MLHLPDVDLKQTLVYQEALAEGREEGRQREVALVLRQLLRRFSALDGRRNLDCASQAPLHPGYAGCRWR